MHWPSISIHSAILCWGQLLLSRDWQSCLAKLSSLKHLLTLWKNASFIHSIQHFTFKGCVMKIYRLFLHCFLRLGLTRWNFLTFQWALGKIFAETRCLKITEKVSFNIASEASCVYIFSGQKLIKNAKNDPFWRVFRKPWSLRSNSVTRQVSFNRTKKVENAKIRKKSNATFWVIFKQCEKVFIIIAHWTK